MGIVLAFAPFIAFLIAERVIGIIPGLFVAALTAAVLLGREVLVRRKSPKILEVGTIVLFGALALAACLSPTAWSVIGVRLAVDVGLLLIVIISIVARRPFTLQYARDKTPPELWNQPQFIRTNYVITAIWALAFVVIIAADLVVFYEPQISLRIAIYVAIAAIFAAAKFTEWYPDRQAAGV